jgi:hypothetical protein
VRMLTISFPPCPVVVAVCPLVNNVSNSVILYSFLFRAIFALTLFSNYTLKMPQMQALLCIYSNLISVNPSFSSAVLQFLISSADKFALPVIPTDISLLPTAFFTSVNI